MLNQLLDRSLVSVLIDPRAGALRIALKNIPLLEVQQESLIATEEHSEQNVIVVDCSHYPQYVKVLEQSPLAFPEQSQIFAHLEGLIPA